MRFEKCLTSASYLCFGSLVLLMALASNLAVPVSVCGEVRFLSYYTVWSGSSQIVQDKGLTQK